MSVFSHNSNNSKMVLRPDPSHLAGGYAILEIPVSEVAGTEVMLAVMETFGEKWLAPSAQDGAGGVSVGDANWQPVPHNFGPYGATRNGEHLEVVLGPELVNKIEGYTQLRLVLTPVGAKTPATGTLTWPEDIVPLAGAKGLGGILVGKRPAQETVSQPPLVSAYVADLDSESNSQSVLSQPLDAPSTPLVEPRVRTLNGVMLAMLALIMLAIGVGWWWMQLPNGGVAPPEVVGSETPAPAPESLSEAEPALATAANPCRIESLSLLKGDLASLRASLGMCDDMVSPDVLLPLIEDAAAQGDASALLIFGRLYDATETDPIFETKAGLGLSDTPTLAAEYYFRARAAGSSEADAPLTAICILLAADDSTLSQGANNDFCR